MDIIFVSFKPVHFLSEIMYSQAFGIKNFIEKS